MNELNSSSNKIEIIEIDEDEPQEKIKSGSNIQFMSASKKPNIVLKPKVSNLGKGIVIRKKPKKTVALVPIECLKYFNQNKGQFAVDTKTLPNTNDKSQVFLYEVDGKKVKDVFSDMNFLKHGKVENLQFVGRSDLKFKTVEERQLTPVETSPVASSDKCSSLKTKIPCNMVPKHILHKPTNDSEARIKKVYHHSNVSLEKDPLDISNLSASSCALGVKIDNKTKVKSYTINNIQSLNSVVESGHNIFEPIITLSEQPTSNFKHNLKVLDDNHRDKDTMLKSDDRTKVMIPERYLKYCKKVNGKYTIDMKTLSMIEKLEKILKRDSDSRYTVNKKTNSEILNETMKKNEQIQFTNKKCEQVTERKNEYKSDPQLKRSATANSCRVFIMEKTGRNKFFGFNKKEQMISHECSRFFQQYFYRARVNPINFICQITREIDKNNILKMVEEIREIHSYCETPNEELFFTKKIEILDGNGRKVRTQHVLPSTKVNTSKRRKFSGIQIKPCCIVLRRDERIEREIKSKLRRICIKKKLDENFKKKLHCLKNPSLPITVLDKTNIQNFEPSWCGITNVIYLKNYEEDYPGSVYQNRSFIDGVSKGRIVITSPAGLQCYFIQNI